MKQQINEEKDFRDQRRKTDNYLLSVIRCSPLIIGLFLPVNFVPAMLFASRLSAALPMSAQSPYN